MQQYFFHSWLILFFLSYKPDSEGEKVHLNQAVRVRRYTIGENSHTVRTLPGYVLVWGGDGEGGMLFFPVCGVIPACCSFLHSALFPHAVPSCMRRYSHMCIFVPHVQSIPIVPSLSRSIPACSWSLRGEGCVCGPACYMRQKYTKKVV